ncbi:MAG: ATP-dependent Zn protease [Microcystaceae cyanobacterium]
MSDRAVSVLAIAVFLIVISVLLGPMLQLSPLIPTLATVGLLGLVTADQLGWQGKATNLFLGSLNTKEQQQRILYHEAGHFLVAYHLDIPVQDYSLSAWEIFKKERSGQGGVEFITEDLMQPRQDWQNRSLLLERLATVCMAGIAAEKLIYGESEGGKNDRQQLQILLKLAGFTPNVYSTKENWALLQSKNLLADHRQQYDSLVEAMEKRLSIEECYALLKSYS